MSFEPGTNPDINTVNVNNRVQVALATLPPEVQRQGIVVKKKSSALLGVIAVHSPKGTYDALYLSNYVTINLLDTIKSTSGVGDATLWGAQDYAMRAWVQTDRLTGLGLTTGDIINAIQSQNVQAAVRIGARPISSDQRLQLNIRTKGRLTSPKEFEAIIIRTNPDGSVLRLGDVARLELGAANMDRETRLNGGAASAIAIYQAPGANAIETLAAVRAKLTETQGSRPGDVGGGHGIHDETEKSCRKSDLAKHTVENSLGIFGQYKKLPADEILQLTTMCGHGMVPANLVERVIAQVKRGKKTLREGAVELTRPCHCGIYNPIRAEHLLRRLLPLFTLDA